jgi:hypothetical protein
VILSDRLLFRAAAVAALIGAVLRAVTTLPHLPLDEMGRETLYLGIDVLLIIGLAGLFVGEPRLRGTAGTLGFILAIVGFLLIRTGARVGVLGSYQVAAALVAIGLALMGVAMLRGGGWPRWAGLAWIAAFVVGLAGALGATLALAAAGLLVCLGYALAAVALWNPQPSPSARTTAP